MADDDNGDSSGTLLPFPQSRVAPPDRPYKELGFGKTAIAMGIPREQLFGHWCSRCEGIWFGYLLEVECPECGNRQG